MCNEPTACPTDRLPLVFLIAGEPSGDSLASRLMLALRRRTGDRIRFAGVGGRAMAGQGLNSLFPMSELALMGVVEVLPHLPRLVRRLRETASAIDRLKPSAVVTIDSPGFSLRVARRIRGSPVPVIHYVAPQLWAWRPGRGRKVARLVDHILALLPFEPQFFAEFGVPCTFVGHPVLESGADRGDGPAFRARYGVGPDAPLVAVLPGSRNTEVRRLLPVFGQALHLLARERPGLTAVIPSVDSVAGTVTAATEAWSLPTISVTDPREKFDAFAASQAAVTKSGTITLELALAGVPMVVAHKVNPATALLARRLISVINVSLVNLLAAQQVVPELLQKACTPEAVAEALGRLLEDDGQRAAQQAGFRKAIGSLGGLAPAPSERAADVVLRIIGQSRAGG
ncbi:MAG: lipid-A-disaccharide synthase [Kiloniellaceae bacterium]